MQIIPVLQFAYDHLFCCSTDSDFARQEEGKEPQRYTTATVFNILYVWLLRFEYGLPLLKSALFPIFQAMKAHTCWQDEGKDLELSAKQQGSQTPVQKAVKPSHVTCRSN